MPPSAAQPMQKEQLHRGGLGEAHLDNVHAKVRVTQALREYLFSGITATS